MKKRSLYVYSFCTQLKVRLFIVSKRIKSYKEEKPNKFAELAKFFDPKTKIY